MFIRSKMESGIRVQITSGTEYVYFEMIQLFL